jgi:L-threonylcarbamoyladenylate synthase
MQKNTPDDEIDLAVALLKGGGLVSFPTETVYGLGGNALSDSAVTDIYAAKQRPSFNPLIVHIASIEMAKKYVQWNDRAGILAEKFWPGSLTLVLPRAENCELSLLTSAGMDSVAIRMPAHPLALALLEKSGLPLAAPSANKSGRVSPTLAQHVQEEFGDDLMVLDGGACAVGIESTIIDLTTTPATILRHGKIVREDLEKYIEVGEYNSDEIKASGMMKSHYAPNAKLRMNAESIEEGEALLAFGKPLFGAAIIENLSKTGNLEEAAANLFRMLRSLDSKKPKTIAVMKIPNHGLGIAINDRLQRAAAPRDI